MRCDPDQKTDRMLVPSAVWHLILMEQPGINQVALKVLFRNKKVKVLFMFSKHVDEEVLAILEAIRFL